jgi:hypothetical protein
LPAAAVMGIAAGLFGKRMFDQPAVLLAGVTT